MPAPLRIGFGLPFSQAVTAARRRGAVLPDDYYAMPPEARRFAWTVTGLAGLDQIRQVQESLAQAVKDGVTFEAWKKTVDPSVASLGKARLDLVYRMNAQTAYMAGHYRNMKAVAGRRPFWMYSAINDGRVRPTHRAMSGHIARHDDPVWNTWFPPAGFNCRCTVISLTEDQARARGWTGTPRPPQPPDPGFAGVPTDGGKALEATLRKRVQDAGPSFAKAYQDALAREAAPDWIAPENLAAGRSIRSEWLKGDPAIARVTDAEAYAVWRYAGMGHARINATLRGLRDVGLNDQEVGIVQALATTIRKLSKPAGAPREVWRGVGVNASTFDDLAKRAKPGAVVESSAFLSTSANQRVATEFVEGEAREVLFRIRTRRGIDLSKISDAPEAEVLIGPGEKFRVTRAQIDGKRIIIEVEDAVDGVPVIGI